MGSGSSASVGELPIYLRYEMDSKDLDLNSSSTPSEGIEDDMKAAAQDIASYQVSFFGCTFWVYCLVISVVNLELLQ